MITWLQRILVFCATAYLAALAILFVFQDRFIFPAPQERHAPAAGFEAAEITTADGLRLEVHWRAPEEGRPTIIWFHGNAGSSAASANETRTLAREGYGLLLASYRGYGGNPGSPSEQGFYEDGRAAMGFLRAQGVAPNDTIIASNSIGSGTAVQMASEYDHAALVMVAPFSSLRDVAAQAMPVFPVRLLLRRRFENAEKLPAIESPVLILHGDADRVVPFELGQRLSRANPNVTFIPFSGAGHDLSYWQEAQDVQDKWLAEQGL